MDLEWANELRFSGMWGDDGGMGNGGINLGRTLRGMGG